MRGSANTSKRAQHDGETIIYEHFKHRTCEQNIWRKENI